MTSNADSSHVDVESSYVDVGLSHVDMDSSRVHAGLGHVEVDTMEKQQNKINKTKQKNTLSTTVKTYYLCSQQIEPSKNKKGKETNQSETNNQHI